MREKLKELVDMNRIISSSITGWMWAGRMKGGDSMGPLGLIIKIILEF